MSGTTRILSQFNSRDPAVAEPLLTLPATALVHEVNLRQLGLDRTRSGSGPHGRPSLGSGVGHLFLVRRTPG